MRSYVVTYSITVTSFVSRFLSLLPITPLYLSHFFFFFNDTATTEIYTLSLHDALPISTGNLDPSTSVDIMRLLDKVNRIGTTVVMATHDQAIVDAMRRRVIELDCGRVIRDQSRGAYS